MNISKDVRKRILDLIHLSVRTDYFNKYRKDMEFLADDIEALLVETEKAYGGCHNCYGKGYATVIEYASGWDTDQDIGSPGGRVHIKKSPFVYCSCDRGKQLKELNGK